MLGDKKMEERRRDVKIQLLEAEVEALKQELKFFAPTKGSFYFFRLGAEYAFSNTGLNEGMTVTDEEIRKALLDELAQEQQEINHDL
jgi:hypothetical protein